MSVVISVEEYPPETSFDSELSFLYTHISLWGSMVFQGQLFYLPADLRQTFRDFCPFPEGSKSEKKSGVGVPVWGEFNGEVEILAPNFSPPNYSRTAVRGGLDAGARALPNFISPATWAFKFGRKKYFTKNFFSVENCRAKTGGNFQ